MSATVLLIEFSVWLLIFARYASSTVATIFFHERLLHSCHFSKHTHFIGVCNLHVGICVGGCTVLDGNRA